MAKTVTIPIEDLNVLRETLIKAFDLLNSLGVTGNLTVPSATPKETKKQREQKYLKLIEGHSRVKKPDYLKRQNGK